MSNHLAIAATTTTLRYTIQHEISRDFPNIPVTISKPKPPDQVEGPLINLYMFQVTPNAAWRNADLRTRRPKGDLTRHGQAALDLHYLFTFYGDDTDCIPEQLLGSTVRALIDRPMLTSDMIEMALSAKEDETLCSENLVEQVQAIRLIPSEMTPDFIFRLWSTFFQIPYSLSFPYQASAILIQSDRAGRAALPVRRRATQVFLGRPIIESIEHLVEGKTEPRLDKVTLKSQLRLQGRDFGKAASTRIKIGKERVEPHTVTDTEIFLDLAKLSREERDLLRAGSSSIQVSRLATEPRPNDEPEEMELATDSNAIPMVLCPRVQIAGDISVEDVTAKPQGEETVYSAQVYAELDLMPFANQSVYLVLFGVSEGILGETAIFRASKRLSQTDEIEFPVFDLAAGEYLARIQVDGGESPLFLNAQQEYSGPIVRIS
ncbi:MAG: DUF4255 domain-containing protein [Cyanobacteria bacterium P01_G01_bin.54]